MKKFYILLMLFFQVGGLEEFGEHVVDNLFPKIAALFPPATMVSSDFRCFSAKEPYN